MNTPQRSLATRQAVQHLVDQIDHLEIEGDQAAKLLYAIHGALVDSLFAQYGSVSLEYVADEITQDIKAFETPSTCGGCSGSGQGQTEIGQCTHCAGSGEVMAPVFSAPPPIFGVLRELAEQAEASLDYRPEFRKAIADATLIAKWFA